MVRPTGEGVPRGTNHSEYVPQNPGVSVTLNTKDQRKYDQKREAALKRGVSAKCAQFLSSHGIDPADVMTAITLQQPFSGTRSTISRIDAGVRDFDTDVWRNEQRNYPRVAADIASGSVALDFQNTGTKAETGIAPGGVTGATIAARSNVYFSGGGISSEFIFHEALHSATGLGDDRLAAKLGLSATGDPSIAIQQVLKEHGCF
jgi:hypothetical protein